METDKIIIIVVLLVFIVGLLIYTHYISSGEPEYTQKKDVSQVDNTAENVKRPPKRYK